MARRSYITRLADPQIERVLSAFPAVMLVGPRASGKTTSAKRLAKSVVRLDRPLEAESFKADPDSALSALPEPVLLDEWQSVPEVLGAVKRAADTESRPGRFILTGSVRASMQAPVWPGTGRIVDIPVFGLTEREIRAHDLSASSGFLQRLASGDLDWLAAPPDSPDLLGYIDLALRGGYPEAVLANTAEDREIWLGAYIKQLLTRDILELTSRRRLDRRLLRRYFTALCLHTAHVPEHKTLYEAAGITRSTALSYDELLTDLFITEEVPAWHAKHLRRLTHAVKRFVIDPALSAAAIGLDRTAVVKDGRMLGRLIETFVASQIRPELSLPAKQLHMYHLREKEGRREVDLIIEQPDGRLVAIEVKAGGVSTSGDARHLSWLRDNLGDRFLAGAILHTGPTSYQLGDRIFALPISTLWA